MSVPSNSPTSGAAPPIGPAPNNNMHLRRVIRFETLAEAIAEAERIAAADRAGRLTRKGNWTAGQALGHLATWIDFGFVGYPITATPEAVAKTQARKPMALRDGLFAGIHLPGIPGGTVGTDVLPVDEGLRRFRSACERLERETPTHPHPYFGELTREEWLQLHLRHSELHLSYLHTENA
jgi:hypothetical protein